MRRVQLTILAAAATISFASIASIASAADLPVKSPVLATPATIVADTWTGFYLGGNIGGTFGRKTWTHDTPASANLFGLVDWFGAPHDVNGVIGGLQGGYNYQIANWVLGVQGDFGWTNADGNGTCGNDFLLIGVPHVNCFTKVKWLASLTGRVGMTWGPALFYGKGGVAWIKDSYRVELAIAPGNTFISGDDTRSGWTVGAGLEYSFLRNWSGFVEYDYYDFGSRRTALDWVPAPGSVEVWDIKQQMHVVKVGVNYRFTGL